MGVFDFCCGMYIFIIIIIMCHEDIDIPRTPLAEQTEGRSKMKKKSIINVFSGGGWKSSAHLPDASDRENIETELETIILL